MVAGTSDRRIQRKLRAEPKLRIVAADDHPLVLGRIHQLLKDEADIELVAKCETGDQVLGAIERFNPDILLIALHMRNTDVFGLLRRLKASRSEPKVILLATDVHEEEVIEATRLEVRGLMLQKIAPRLLVTCIRKVQAGEEWLEHTATIRALAKLIRRDAAIQSLSAQLTHREIEITRLAARGFRNKQIADDLALGEGTVKGHLHRIYQKLNVTGRMELTDLARARHLV